MRWVKAKRIFSVERHLQTFVEMCCRGGDFDTFTQSDFMAGGLPLGPAKHLFNAIQELIRSKDERIYIRTLCCFYCLHIMIVAELSGTARAALAPAVALPTTPTKPPLMSSQNMTPNLREKFAGIDRLNAKLQSLTIRMWALRSAS